MHPRGTQQVTEGPKACVQPSNSHYKCTHTQSTVFDSSEHRHSVQSDVHTLQQGQLSNMVGCRFTRRLTDCQIIHTHHIVAITVKPEIFARPLFCEFCDLRKFAKITGREYSYINHLIISVSTSLIVLDTKLTEMATKQ